MVRADFSEFTYGYACIREAEALITSVYPLTAIPTQPSLLTEGKVGYDAALFAVDYTLFMQFKRSDFISRRHTSKCEVDGRHEHRCSWMFLQQEHYRFDIDSASNQFHAMLAYEKEIAAGKWAGDAFYAAPFFHRDLDLSDYYFAGTVLENSIFLDPSDVTSDGLGHRISATHLGHLLVMSDPTFIEDTPTWNTVSSRIRNRTRQGVVDQGNINPEEVEVVEQGVSLAGLVDFFSRLAWGQRDVPEAAASPMQRLQAAARRLDGEVLVIGRRLQHPG